jgi:hypothetical protein
VFLLLMGARFLRPKVLFWIVCHSNLVHLAFGVSVVVVYVALHGRVWGFLLLQLVLLDLLLPLFFVISLRLSSQLLGPFGHLFLITLPMVGLCLRHLQNVIWFSSDEYNYAFFFSWNEWA